MTDHTKKLVTPAHFVELLNEELTQSDSYQVGMLFIPGYDFIAPMLSESENIALAKWVFDRVSSKYTFTTD